MTLFGVGIPRGMASTLPFGGRGSGQLRMGTVLPLGSPRDDAHAPGRRRVERAARRAGPPKSLVVLGTQAMT
jgi:hypothetical protein